MLGMIVDIQGVPFVTTFDSIGIAQTFQEIEDMEINPRENVIHIVSRSDDDTRIKPIMTVTLSQPFFHLVNKSDYQVHCLKLYHEITTLAREMGIHYE